MQTILDLNNTTPEYLNEAIAPPQAISPQSPFNHLWLLSDDSPQVRGMFTEHLLEIESALLHPYATDIARGINTALLQEPLSYRCPWLIIDETAVARQHQYVALLEKLPLSVRPLCRNGLLRQMFSIDLSIQQEALRLLEEDHDLPKEYIFPLMLADKQLILRRQKYSMKQTDMEIEDHLFVLRRFHTQMSNQHSFSDPLSTASGLLINAWESADRKETHRLQITWSTYKEALSQLSERNSLIPMYLALLAACEQGPAGCLHECLEGFKSTFLDPLHVDLQTYLEVFGELARKSEDQQTLRFLTPILAQNDQNWVSPYINSLFAQLDTAEEFRHKTSTYRSLGQLLRGLEKTEELPHEEVERHQERILRNLKRRFHESSSIAEQRALLRTMTIPENYRDKSLAFTGEVLMGEMHPRDKAYLLPTIVELYEQYGVVDLPSTHPTFLATIGALKYQATNSDSVTNVDAQHLVTRALEAHTDLLGMRKQHDS